MPEDDVQDVYGWSPGKVPVMEPADTAWALDEGSDLVVQLHMVPGATAQPVRPSVGLFFSTTPPTRVPIVVKLESKAIDIPAGDAAYVVEDSYTLPVDVEAVSVYPHAHYLATRMDGTATLPDGRVTPLVSIPRWNIRWQDQYRYRTPLVLPRGTTLRMRFVYDNSAANPNNRFKPPRRVQWGPLSTDEMGALWLEVVPTQPEDVAVLDARLRGARAERRHRVRRARAAWPRPATPRSATASRRDTCRPAASRTRWRSCVAHRPDRAARRRGPQQPGHRAPDPRGARRGHARAAAGGAAEARRRPVRFNLGNGFYAAGRLDDAVREFTRAVALNGENADAHFNLAMILGPRGRVDEAIAHLQRVIDIDPQRADAYRNLAWRLACRAARRCDRACPHRAASPAWRPGQHQPIEPAARRQGCTRHSPIIPAAPSYATTGPAASCPHGASGRSQATGEAAERDERHHQRLGQLRGQRTFRGTGADRNDSPCSVLTNPSMVFAIAAKTAASDNGRISASVRSLGRNVYAAPMTIGDGAHQRTQDGRYAQILQMAPTDTLPTRHSGAPRVVTYQGSPGVTVVTPGRHGAFSPHGPRV